MTLKFAYQSDRGYRPASARNLGIRLAAGRICLFVDSGIILKSDCIAQHLDCYDKYGSNVAVIGTIMGLTYDESEASLLKSIIDPTSADETISRCHKEGKFGDIREKIFRRYNNKLEGLHMPWSLFWSGHVSVPTRRLFEVGLFDEAYDGNWGCEDNDLGMRLTLSGIPLHLCNEAEVLHLPHDFDCDAKQSQGYENCQYFHNKFNVLETSVFLQHYRQEVSVAGVIDFHAVIAELLMTKSIPV